MRHALLLLLPALAIAACGGAVVESSTDKGRQSATREDTADDTDGTEGQAAPATSDECKLDAQRSCANNGIEFCVRGPDGHNVWGACSPSESSSTPLVVVFDGAPVTFASAPSAATFDIAGDGASHVTSWPTARTPWLALDRDGNGRIDDGAELFGSMTRLSTGLRAKNGFEALAELDSNHDGAITSADEAFAKLVMWADADSDRTAGRGELTPASERIVRIELGYRVDPRCTAGGDCEVERAKLVYRADDGSERTGEIVDVHLRHR